MRRALILLAAAAAAGLIHAELAPLRLSLDPVPGPTPPGAAAAGATDSTAPRKVRIGLEETRRLYEDPSVVFVDASLAEDFEAGRIPGAHHLPPDALAQGAMPEFVNQISRDAVVVVYCRSSDCDAAVMVALRLEEFGFAGAVVFEAGFAAWKSAGLPVQAGR